uniref:FXYD domain-containing ion transport regulator n=1 Tax=Sinocyclocheilus anshuiensis TaxID=1608454 RepID=A0A671LVH3_9TELE
MYFNVFTESYMYMDQSAFHYDYETLRTTGFILAVVMFVTGILIAVKNGVIKKHWLFTPPPTIPASTETRTSDLWVISPTR